MPRGAGATAAVERRPPAINPWVTAPARPRPDSPPPTRPPTARPGPQPGVPPLPVSEQLPRRTISRQELLTPLWWVGAHGGAGESTLEHLLPGSKAANHAWPISPSPDRAARVLLVARTSFSGLTAAQRALRDWASGAVAVQLDGLVLMADAPGRLPKELRALSELVASATPGHSWQLPWQPDWRLSPPSLQRASHEAQHLIAHLTPKEP
jgi:hypothetical protein